jgi:ABC-type transporter Mla subunit MlaD
MTLILGCLFLFLGCQDRGLNLKIRFQEINGLKAADHVIFEGNRIGEVTGVSYTKEGVYLVTVLIAETFANAANSHSRFTIGRDPVDRAKRAVEVVNIEKGGQPLEDGSVVEGTSKATVLLNDVWGDFKDKLNKFGDTLEELAGPLRDIPESEEVRKLERQMKGLMEDLKRKGGKVREKFDKEILPELQKKIEELRDRLRKFGREKELDPLEEDMRKLRKI